MIISWKGVKHRMPSEARKILANNIVYFRLKKNWTQEEFADRLGSTPNYISSIEHAKRNIRVDYVDHIAKTFKIDVEELFVKRNQIVSHRIIR